MNDLYLSFLFELEIWLLSFDFFNNQACRQKDRRTASNQFVPKTKESTFLATLVTQRRIQKKGFRTIHLLTSEMHKTWQTTCNPFQTRIRFGLKQAFVLLKWLSTRVKHIFCQHFFQTISSSMWKVCFSNQIYWTFDVSWNLTFLGSKVIKLYFETNEKFHKLLSKTSKRFLELCEKSGQIL